MKTRCILIFSLFACLTSFAQINITKVDNLTLNDEMFIEMATMAAQAAQANGFKPEGAVITINGVWRATGTASPDETPEENAIDRSQRTELKGAVVYTVNQPTSSAINAILMADIDAVYFVNPAVEVISAGLYTQNDYDYSSITSGNKELPIYQIIYAPAKDLLK